MATYRSRYSAYSNDNYRLKLVVNETIPSNYTSTNKTNVSAFLYAEVNNSSYGYYNLVGSLARISINGKNYDKSNSTFDGRSTGDKLLFSVENIEIEHSSDGSKTISIGAYHDTGVGLGNATIEDSLKLTNIPRASSVSGGSGDIGSKTTINISRASSSFTHTLKYSFGDLTGTIATGVGTRYSWTIPTSFYSQLPNANSGTGTITCKTYNGSTLVGTKTCSFTANVTDSDPVVGTFTYKDSNSTTTAITDDNQRIIRNNSNLIFTLGTATAKNSAFISKYEITFNNVTKSRTSAGTLDFGIINLSSNATATLKVTDSRGNTATKQITVTIDNWVLPTAVISLNRKNNFYSETYLKVDGTYSSLNSKNSMTIQYQYKKVSDSSYSSLSTLSDNTQVTLDFDNEYQWNIKVLISDKIGTTTYNLVLDRGMPITYFDRVNSSVGINAMPNKGEALKVAKGNINFDGKVTVGDIKCKNLWNNGSTLVANRNADIVLNNPIPAGTYTLSWSKMTTTSTTTPFLRFRDVNANSVSSCYLPLIENSVTFTLTADAYDFRFYPSNNYDNSDGVSTTLEDIQIEIGTEATEYTPLKVFGFESGSDNNSNWIKYEDGRMECYVIKSQRVDITESVGSLYQGTFTNISFPVTFVEEPYCFVDNNSEAIAFIGRVGSITTTGIGVIRLLRPTSSSLEITLVIHAVGRWK